MNTKVPAIIVSSVVCLMIGVGIGVVGMSGFGYKPPLETFASAGQPPAPRGAPAKGDPAKGGGEKGKKGKGGGFGGGPKTQLAQLVTRLDVLTGRNLHLDLPAETCAKVYQQLQDMAGDQELSDETARQKLDALLDLLRDQKEPLEAAGFRWPEGGGRGGGPMGGGNPFKDEKTAKHLKDLQERMEKSKTKA